MKPELERGDALIIVDVQVDFCPGGALPVPDGDAIVPELNEWVANAVRAGIPVVASRDWHPRQHLSFASEGGEWPVHCVQDSAGAAFHPDLALPAEVIKVSKGVRFDKDQYSVFDETGLGAFLHRQGVRRVFVGGLALDVCVRASVLDGCAAGFEVHLVTGATRAIDPERGRRAIDEMRSAGAAIGETA